MSLLTLDPTQLSTVQNKVVVITGGGDGIGLATVISFLENGAKVVVGDLRSEKVLEQSSKFGDRLRFVRCNVASYQDQLNLFKIAQETFGSVDVAIANAGTGNFPDPISSIENILEEPSLPEVDVNLRGALFTARIAVYYMRQNGSGDLILTSSIGGFKETIGLTPYVASKHGVIGIMRGLRLTSMRDNIRVNVVCPWMTFTSMTKGIAPAWQQENLPYNKAQDVANAMLICVMANQKLGVSDDGRKDPFHGKIIFVGGGNSYEIEDRLQNLEPDWLGRENSRVVELGQQFLHNGETSWQGPT
ncbi:hypothetical protein ONS95_009434 [Cadophora gregata]|uniref:uncharacterized protein n=1 Tax=Cadophora gregata TaxID=51156 RepID=UPI0026DD9EF9|nr:uncharacterized protein ONS95_009434 [Cadophora gregata]KAK0124482.1 hypothetical protein ONS95_009434 [Cadophora gregata]KAK0129664.1 hypothetical protein ONS96_000227 [Cadophora gregata f. sp. sojae]